MKISLSFDLPYLWSSNPKISLRFLQPPITHCEMHDVRIPSPSIMYCMHNFEISRHKSQGILEFFCRKSILWTGLPQLPIEVLLWTVYSRIWIHGSDSMTSHSEACCKLWTITVCSETPERDYIPKQEPRMLSHDIEAKFYLTSKWLSKLSYCFHVRTE